MVAKDSSLLQKFEELFQNRYTENDKDYKSAVQGGQRFMTYVPVMTPWPKYVRGGRGNRHMYAGQSRGRVDRGGSRSSRYNRGPNEYHYHRKDYRSNDFDHYHSISSSDNQYGDTTFPIKQDDMIVHHDQPQLSCSEPQHHSIPQSSQDTNYECHQPLANGLDSFKELPIKPPTESDINAILNTAHDSNVIASKSNNLTKEKIKKRKETGKKKTKLDVDRQNPSKSKSLKNASRIPPKSSKGDNPYNRHGSTESASHILSAELTGNNHAKQDRKRKHGLIEQRSDSENEQVDVESYYEHQLTANSPLVDSSTNCPSSSKQPFYVAANTDGDDNNLTSSLVVRLPLLPSSKPPTNNKIGHGVRENTDSSIKQSTALKKPKKRHKHHKQFRTKKMALQGTDSCLPEPLTLKISLQREGSQ